MMKRSFWILLFLCASAASWLSASGARLTRAPYLQKMTAHSVLVAWRTDTATPGRISVKTPDARNETERILQENSSTREHAILLDNLRQNSFYQYQIWGETQPLTGWISFHTFPDDPKAPFSFAVLGDSGTASGQQKAVAFQMMRLHPDLILHTGDVIYGGKSDQDFDAKFFSIYQPMLEQIPVFPSLGNHDISFDGGIPYLRNFYLPQDSPGKGRYYSFNCGNAHFTALDSNQSLSPGSSQYVWLVNDLQHASVPIRIVYFHHPVYSTGYHGSDLSLRKILAHILEHYHVILVLNGHDHDYERSVPIHGITYVVTGGGGAMLYPPSNESWTASSKTAYHLIFCRVSGRKIHLEAVDDQGNRFDQANLEEPK